MHLVLGIRLLIILTIARVFVGMTHSRFRNSFVAEVDKNDLRIYYSGAEHFSTNTDETLPRTALSVPDGKGLGIAKEAVDDIFF